VTTPIEMRQVFYALCRRDFRAFLRAVFPACHNGQALDENWHLDAVAMALMDIFNGGQTRMIFNLPPRALKTFTISVAYPVWMIGHAPGKSVLIVSHTQKLSETILGQARTLLKSAIVQAVFPHLKKAVIKTTRDDITTDSNGRLRSFSIKGNMTGHGGDLIIIDDPIDATDSLSPGEMDRVNRVIDLSIIQRLNHPATDPVLLVMQRLAPRDPSGYLLEQGNWSHLSLPVIATREQSIKVAPNKYHNRHTGDLLFPSRYPASYLEGRKKALGPAGFAAQFQQEPVPNAGGVINLQDFGRYEKLPASFDMKLLTVDPATGSDSGSYSAMVLGRISNNRLYIENVVRNRIDIAKQFDVICAGVEAHDIKMLVVEDSSISKSLLQMLYQEYQRRPFNTYNPMFLQTLTVSESKTARIEAGLDLVRNKQVLLPNSAPWLRCFETELIEFPGGAFNDQVDALSMAIKAFRFWLTDPSGRVARGLPPYALRG
jgi:predicted phage terminase large subunit-like protein